ncbi:hypothetical protein MCEJIRE27_01423 [Candidatus Nanopelagicaceae bacterium]
MKLNSKSQYLQTFLILAALVQAPAAHGESSVVTPPLTKCFIDIRDAHISTTIYKKEGRLAVKVNAISRCNTPQRNVTLTVKIYKEGRLGSRLVKEKSTDRENPKSQGLVVKNQFTYVYCKNRTKTRYYGIATAQAVINGKNYSTPPVRSENITELNCGT